MLLSIIIPVYNVESFVEQCLRSCESQNIPKNEYEIIVVNDGSKDNSLDIVNNIAEEFSNIKILSQPNGGLSAARNTGMRNAQGDYYMFVDSDDWIAENCLGKLVEKLNDERPDALAICAANVIDGKCCRRMSYVDETPIAGRDFLRRGVSPCVPFSIWSAQFLKEHDLKFFEGIFHEDSEFSPRAYYWAKRVSFTNELVYFVRQNPNSITRTINPKRSFDLLGIVCPHLADFAQTADSSYKHIYYDDVALYLNNAISYICDASEVKQKELNDIIYNKREIISCLHKSTHFKYRLEAVLFFIFPRHYVQIYKILKYCH